MTDDEAKKVLSRLGGWRVGDRVRVSYHENGKKVWQLDGLVTELLSSMPRTLEPDWQTYKRFDGSPLPVQTPNYRRLLVCSQDTLEHIYD